MTGTRSDMLHSCRLEFLTADDLPECVALVAETFSLQPETVADWFEKRVNGNPWQPALKGCGVAFRKERELVAFRAMFAQPWWFMGQDTVVAFAAHTCAKKEFRGQGLGAELIRRSRDCAKVTGSTTAGVATQPIYAANNFTVVGEDNDFYRCRVSYRKSLEKRTGGFLGSAGAVMDFVLLPGTRYGGAKNFSFSLIQQCDERFDELWDRSRGGYASCLARTSTYLNWRLFDYPTCPLSMGAVFDGSQRLRAYGVWHVVTFDQHVRMAVLRDLFAPVDDRAAIMGLVCHLLAYWRKEGITWASFEVAHPGITSLFREAGFTHTPSIGSRYYVHDPAGMEDVVVRGWLRSGLDGDYFDLSDSHIVRQSAQQGRHG
ncbi:MAG: hypothetical protein ED859_07470 [Desulfuromonadales bacterium]|nr:MAG: hypothetical protein ED859_07470 [Desulfuromonadales bacterium]